VARSETVAPVKFARESQRVRRLATGHVGRNVGRHHLATLQAKRRFESLLARNLVDGLLDVFFSKPL
jgi:hypothetical protein